MIEAAVTVAGPGAGRPRRGRRRLRPRPRCAMRSPGSCRRLHDPRPLRSRAGAARRPPAGSSTGRRWPSSPGRAAPRRSRAPKGELEQRMAGLWHAHARRGGGRPRRRLLHARRALAAGHPAGRPGAVGVRPGGVGRRPVRRAHRWPASPPPSPPLRWKVPPWCAGGHDHDGHRRCTTGSPARPPGSPGRPRWRSPTTGSPTPSWPTCPIGAPPGSWRSAVDCHRAGSGCGAAGRCPPTRATWRSCGWGRPPAPLNPAFPEERNRTIAAQAELDVIVHDDLTSGLGGLGGRPARRAAGLPGDVAYLLFTSGSTGRRRGCCCCTATWCRSSTT